MTKSEYRAYHRVLAEEFGKAEKCTFCETKIAKRYEWALKKGHQYSNDIEDYMELCASCHRRYDYTDERKKKQAEIFRKQIEAGTRTVKTALGKFGADNKSSKPILQIDKVTDNIIAEYVSMTAAYDSTGILISSLSQCLHGKTKTAGKYKWKYKQ